MQRLLRHRSSHTPRGLARHRPGIVVVDCFVAKALSKPCENYVMIVTKLSLSSLRPLKGARPHVRTAFDGLGRGTQIISEVMDSPRIRTFQSYEGAASRFRSASVNKRIRDLPQMDRRSMRRTRRQAASGEAVEADRIGKFRTPSNWSCPFGLSSLFAFGNCTCAFKETPLFHPLIQAVKCKYFIDLWLKTLCALASDSRPLDLRS